MVDPLRFNPTYNQKDTKEMKDTIITPASTPTNEQNAILLEWYGSQANVDSALADIDEEIQSLNSPSFAEFADSKSAALEVLCSL